MNILSIDLESWVHFWKDALKDEKFCVLSKDRKNMDNNYIPEVTRKLLSLLKGYDQKATFFVIGEIYDWYPETIEMIKAQGHEVAYHTQSHSILKNKVILERELGCSTAFLERIRPIGFRATQAYITRDCFACLAKWGFRYSSSTYDDYEIRSIDGIDEIPVTSVSYRKRTMYASIFPKHLTLRLLTRQIPFGSGLFFALIGSKISLVIDRLANQNIPTILVLHPWQIYRPKDIRALTFKLNVLRKNLLCLPYTFSIEKSLEKVLLRHRFTSFKEYFNYDGQKRSNILNS